MLFRGGSKTGPADQPWYRAFLESASARQPGGLTGAMSAHVPCFYTTYRAIDGSYSRAGHLIRLKRLGNGKGAEGCFKLLGYLSDF
ncbi:hypothetical protein BURKHO8Y_20146 [Burkholderia sp. 8Y]|nr:hypothetical protein BURKHO8Y_20146 [Burkholderia sp. 8Y]